MKKLILIACTSALLLLPGCGSAPGGTSASTPEQVVYMLHGDYAAALTAAVAYKKLPPCTATSTPICSEPAIVAQLQRADDLAFEALSAAQRTVRSPAATGVERALNLARDAIGAFVAITAKLRR